MELSTSGSLPTPISDRESVRQEDLETISRFFATRPEEDGEDDADVWGLLTSQVRSEILRTLISFSLQSRLHVRPLQVGKNFILSIMRRLMRVLLS